MKESKQSHNITQLSTALMELLLSKGYTPGTMNNYRRMLTRISTFMKERNIKAYTEEVGEAFFDEYIAKHNSSVQHLRQIKTILRRLDELCSGTGFQLTKQNPEHTVPAQFLDLLDGYLESCIRAGNKQTTIKGKRRFLAEFLNHLTDAGCDDICGINTNSICQAVLSLNNKDSYAVVRPFLCYLYETDVLKRDYSAVIPKYRRPFIIPTTYTDDEIRSLEKSIDRKTSAGKRNYAIFLLAARLGLRSGDIVDMTFDNIDFKRNKINLTQDKTGQPLSLTLLPEIREAIMEYVDNARPKTKNTYIFIRANAPFERITTSIIRHALTESFKKANIDISHKKHGPHTMRSSMATSMVNSNIPYEVARKALGHVDPQAIKHYAKTDIENLRLHAIDVPSPSGIFNLILQGRERI